MTVKLIVAHDEARGIGRCGDMAWHIPGESQWAARTTRTARPGMRNALIMGRITYLSIPEKRRPLAGRVNVVVSTRPYDFGTGVYLASGLAEALRLAAGLDDVDDVYIFGGTTIYREALRTLTPEELLISVVAGEHDCDTFFPDLPAAYRLESSTTVTYDGAEVRHDHYRRDTERYCRTADEGLVSQVLCRGRHAPD